MLPSRGSIRSCTSFQTYRSVETRADPHPLFDTAYYLTQCPDVAEQGINPLLHFLQTGWLEGQSPHLLFDAPYYLDRYPDVAEQGINPLRALRFPPGRAEQDATS